LLGNVAQAHQPTQNATINQSARRYAIKAEIADEVRLFGERKQEQP
jgi:hypothetical protein